MRSKDAMESGGDYDQMLRGMFESCDTVGLGLLTPKDFEKLCMKLSIQEHSSLLSEVLFPEENERKLLPYETFRDTLVLFLTGDAGFGDNTTGDVQSKHRHSSSEDCWNGNGSHGYIDDNRIDFSPKSGMISEYPDDVYFCEVEEHPNNNSGSQRLDRGSPPPPFSSPRKNRRYGRRSKPDMDLLQNRERNKDSERSAASREEQADDANVFRQQDESLPENLPRQSAEVSIAIEEDKTKQSTMKDELFTERGNDENWKDPDSEWASDVNNDFEDDSSAADDVAVKAVQTELENAWSLVVGTPASDPMDETQLGSLCAELGLGHICRPTDISELFEALDSDNDGFVTFTEFSEQMSMFIGGANSDPVDSGPGPVEPETVRAPPERDSPGTDLNVSNTSLDHVFETSDVTIGEIQDFDVTLSCNDVRASENTSLSGAVSPVGDSVFYTSAIELGPTESTPVQSEARPTSSTPVPVTSSEAPDTRSSLSLDSDTSLLCPPVVPVEPRQLAAINRGRRRRRSSAVAASNPALVRQQKRKSLRSIPLPYHHPDSIRRLEELPLSYLTEKNERYISLEALQQAWEAEGLVDSSQVLEALQLKTTEQSISVEALTEVFEMECEENIVQKAALSLYRGGLKFYRSHFEHERAERSELETRVEHLMAQLHKCEERPERADVKFKKQIVDLEKKYKLEIRVLNEKLRSVQEQFEQCKQEPSTDYSAELLDMTERYEKSRTLAQDLKEEVDKLLQLKQEAESRLSAAEEYICKARETMVVTCRRIAASSRENAARKKRTREWLRMIEEEDQAVERENDEMVDDLQRLQNSWSHSRLNAPQNNRQKDPELHRDDIFEELNCHRSMCQVFAQESPRSPTSTNGRFLTSSAQSEGSEKVVSKSDSLQTPSVTQSKPRIVQSSASLVMVSPTFTSETGPDT